MERQGIIGIDEVGRGPLAGPVVVAALFLPNRLNLKIKCLPRLRDSKKLSFSQRENWFRHLKNHPKIVFATARIYPRGIDRLNISCAANLAAKRAYQKLLRLPEVSGNQVQIYLDGGLFLGNKLDSLNLGAKTVIRGDEKIKAIKLASIVAKVSRDRYMVRLHKKDGAYGFDEHKGYGTKRHIQAIKKHRPSANHRLTFVKNYHKI